jgi:hypothetical protein
LFARLPLDEQIAAFRVTLARDELEVLARAVKPHLPDWYLTGCVGHPGR